MESDGTGINTWVWRRVTSYTALVDNVWDQVSEMAHFGDGVKGVGDGPLSSDGVKQLQDLKMALLE